MPKILLYNHFVDLPRIKLERKNTCPTRRLVDHYSYSIVETRAERYFATRQIKRLRGDMMQSFSIPLKLVASPKFVKLCIQIVATFSNVRMKNFFRDAPPPPTY